MNALKLMLSKDKVDYLYADCPLDKALTLFTESGYSAVPVIEDDGSYIGTVCDKDFLKCYSSHGADRNMEECQLKDIINVNWNPAFNVYTNVDDVLLLSMNQNFLPVVDDDEIFIGIITRKAIIQFLSERSSEFGGLDQLPALSNQHNIEKMMIAVEDQTSGYRMFFKMYETAMREVCTRLETIDEFLAYKYNRKPLHHIIEIPVNFLEARQYLPVEIQLRTEPMDYWASLEHDLKYKPVQNDNGIDISNQLIECSCELAETEKKMQNLARLIGCNVDDRDDNWQKSWVKNYEKCK